jgi:AcrR family transcriptional regulator
MPKELFFELPEEKRTRIINALYLQLQENDLEKFSIKRLCKDAQIAHGSFYTYFDNKEDFIDYAFHDQIKVKQAERAKMMNSADGWCEFVGNLYMTLSKVILTKKTHYTFIDYIIYERNYDIDNPINPYAHTYIQIANEYKHLFLLQDDEYIFRVLAVSRIFLEQALMNTDENKNLSVMKDLLVKDLLIYTKGLKDHILNEQRFD